MLIKNLWQLKTVVFLHWCLIQSDQKILKNCPIFENVAKTAAKISKIQLNILNIYIKLLLNINISTTNHVWNCSFVQKCKKFSSKSGRMVKFRPIWSHWSNTCSSIHIVPNQFLNEILSSFSYSFC